jgi:TetR/AcrR family transcriptional regulator of autoinduction and epiphytic fitness
MKKPVRRASRRVHSPGRPSASESTARIESLLDVAAEVFTERGYQGASLDEIARRAGASKQTLYARFPSKAELFQAVLKRETERAHLRFSGILLADLPMEEVLEEFGMEAIRIIMAERSRRLIRTISATVESFPALAKGLWRQISESGIRILANYIRGQSRMGVLRETNPEMAANVFHGLTMGPYFLPAQMGVKAGPPMDDPRVYVKEAVRVFLSAYAPELSVHPRTGATKSKRRK